MSDFIEEYSQQWGDDPSSLLDEYDYHPELTAELDELEADEFDHEILYKIVLWKLSRFPYVTDEVVGELKGIADIETGKHQEARGILKKLLRTPGIALPMASTIVRFINPNTFQIIDDRAYRVLFPGEAKYPSKPQKITDGYID